MGFGNILDRIAQKNVRCAISRVEKANAFLDRHEEKFKSATPKGKIYTLFVVAAAATLVPGGYTVFPVLYLGRWVSRAIKKKKPAGLEK